ncbi:hypothetical protein RJZ57_001278, partial [Blastomyces gilchristii]
MRTLARAVTSIKQMRDSGRPSSLRHICPTNVISFPSSDEIGSDAWVIFPKPGSIEVVE